MTPGQKVAEINKIFNNSYRSPLSVIILDDIERLIGMWYLIVSYLSETVSEWVNIGANYNNQILQSFLFLLLRPPPKVLLSLLIFYYTT